MGYDPLTVERNRGADWEDLTCRRGRIKVSIRGSPETVNPDFEEREVQPLNVL